MILLTKLLFFTISSALIFSVEAYADIYFYRDSRGIMTFTNAPSHSGYRTIIRTGPRRSSVRSGIRRFEPIVRLASERFGVDPHLVWAVIKVESDFDPDAISRKGARGLMQLMPATARMHHVGNIHDPGENIRAGVRHLRLLLDRFNGNFRLSLAAYNAGIKAVERYRNVPPFSETKKYVRLVLQYYQHYRAQGTVLAGYNLNQEKTY